MNSEKLNKLSKQISSPVPFWFLNGYIDEWHIIHEFEMMKEKGIGDVIVHPRYGLQVEYLSDGWFEIFGWCVREAKKLGMHVWIYDEYNWPSGTAGMSVMDINEDYKGKYLAIESKPIDEIDLDTFHPGKYMVAANIEGGRVTKTKEITDIKSLETLKGNWHIFNCTLKQDKFYIDTLSFDAVNCFKHVTYDEYYNRFGDEFGKTIRAIFTDEPSIYWVSVGYDDCNIPYTDDYFSTFEKKYGYSPVAMIPYLFYPGKEGTAFRADYWEHAGFLFNERYHGNLSGWCRDHGIIYTGHNNHEEPLRYQIRFQGDMFGTMRTMDIPGVDHLGKQTLGNNWISIIGHKICSSLAHTSGKARCMSESFGIMDWDTTYTNMKRVTDWQYALGINLLIPHAIYHTISGMTKRESPPSFFYQSPHWKDFDYFADYIKRLEEMLCGGRHLCKVAVMYPKTGLWSGYQSDRKTSDFEHTENFLDSLCLELVKNQIDFDLVDFESLNDAQSQNGVLTLADEQYQALIVPSSSYMRQAEVTLLTIIAKSGVKTTFFYKSMEPLPHNLPEKFGGAGFIRTEELDGFVDVLKKDLDEDIQISGGGADEIMAYRREKDGRKITFLLNRSDKHRKVVAMMKDYPDAAIFDQETGTYTRLEGKRAGKKTQVQLRFQPNQSYFIISNVPDAKPIQDISGEPTPIAINNLNVEIPFNTASLYHFTYTREGSEPIDVDVRSNPRFIPCNWDPNPPTFDQYAGVYETEIEVNSPSDGIRLILDKDYADCEVYLNETLIQFEPCCKDSADCFFLTDYQDIQAPISDLIKPGVNHFKVISPTKHSEPLRLIGDFRVQLSGRKVILLESADVNIFRLEQDYPFYSGTVTYKADFTLDREYSALVLNLHDVRDTASIRINGQLAGKRLWLPYTINIQSFTKTGVNTLEIEVRNNMANLIQGNPRSLGLLNKPTLAGFD